MCVIYFAQNADKQDPKTINEMLKNAMSQSWGNPDGFGWLTIGKDTNVYKSPSKFAQADALLAEKSFLASKLGILHLRYATAGNCTMANTQPIDMENCVVIHNGMLEGAEYPARYYKGYSRKNENSKSDTFIFAEKLNQKLYSMSMIKALKDTLTGKGWYRLFIYDKRSGKTYYVANDDGLKLSYNPETGQIYGSTKGVDIDSKSHDIGSFSLKTCNMYSFVPKADTIYLVQGVKWQVCDTLRPKYESYPGHAWGFTSNGSRTMHDIDESSEYIPWDKLSKKTSHK